MIVEGNDRWRECVDKVLADYDEVVGRLFLFQGVLDGTCGLSGDPDSISGMFLLRVRDVSREAFVESCVATNWQEGWVDTTWDVDVLLWPDSRRLQSCWVHGPSRNYQTGEVTDMDGEITVVDETRLWEQLLQMADEAGE